MIDNKFFTSRDKTLLKILFLVYLFFVVILNWTNLSWFLNVRTAPALVAQYTTSTIENIQGFIANVNIPNISFLNRGKKDKDDNQNITEPEEPIEVTDPALVCGENRITVSAIDIDVPLVEAGGVTEAEYREALDRGVLHFPTSSLPGNTGLSVLLGHSAPPGWPKIKHDWVFTEIDKLQEGDVIEICFNNRKWQYAVIDTNIGQQMYEVGEDVPPLFAEDNKEELVLMTCWPPGNNENRIGVRAVIKE